MVQCDAQGRRADAEGPGPGESAADDAGAGEHSLRAKEAGWLVLWGLPMEQTFSERDILVNPVKPAWQEIR